MKADMAEFIIYMFYKMDSDSSKRKGDVCGGLKVGGI